MPIASKVNCNTILYVICLVDVKFEPSDAEALYDEDHDDNSLVVGDREATTPRGKKRRRLDDADVINIKRELSAELDIGDGSSGFYPIAMLGGEDGDGGYGGSGGHQQVPLPSCHMGYCIRCVLKR